MNKKFKVKKGDEVVLLAGKDKGKKGEILKVLTSKDRALVKDCNMITRHTRQTQNSEGGLVRKEASIHISNLAIVDPKDGVASRVGYKFLKDGKKVRFAKKSGEVIDG